MSSYNQNLLMVRPDFTKFHSTIADELTVKKNRVRNLIGGSHWLTDGEYKESILREIIRGRLSDTVVACKGFACLENSSNNNAASQSSGQLDIVLRDSLMGTLMKTEDTVFVLPQAVKGIIEVKTKLNNSRKASNKQGLLHAIQKLSNDIKFIRENGGRDCLAGLFIYDENTSEEFPHRLLKTLQMVCKGDNNRVINYVSYGARWFVRFWTTSEREKGVPYSADTQAWHLYKLDKLAQAYFINNFAVSLSPIPIWEQSQSSFFPLDDEGKAYYRSHYITLDNNDIKSFS